MDQIINDINNIQMLEQSQLELLKVATDDAKEGIINKVNGLLELKLGLYNTLGQLNKMAYEEQSTVKSQAKYISVVENSLIQDKNRLNKMLTNMNTKLRVAEINEYYGEKYQEHTIFLQYCIYTLVWVGFILFLNNNQLLSASLFRILLGVGLAIGLYYIVSVYVSIASRDNMVYSNYSQPSEPLPTANANANGSTLNKGISTSLTCIGNACCSSGMQYDTTQNKCVAN